ncbi:hypothetical protein AAVH_26485 [Aphelenchoides avenae]|nr:hypothetical protein AAVH_26485 [Aphelenchus avenae]
MFSKSSTLLVLALALAVSTAYGLRFRNEPFSEGQPENPKCSDGTPALVECDAQTALCPVDPSLGCESIQRKLYCCEQSVAH